jgi:hypothetical protein
MKNAVFAVFAASMLGACGTTSFGDRLQSEGAALSSLGNQWEKGEAMVKRGNALIDKGNDRIADGREMVEDGEVLVRRGRELQVDAESEYQNQQ